MMNMGKYTLYILLISILVLSSFQGNKEGNLSIVNLRCEMLSSPEGIDSPNPRLSWEISTTQRGIEQVSYQVLVASSTDKLKANTADLWNSGEVKSDESVNVTYRGKPLSSGMKCFWKVKIKTNKGESSWTQPVSWSMGLLKPDDWKGKWIGLDRSFPWDSITKASRLSARYFRKEFDTKKSIKRATAYISGLGMYELYLNGKRVGDQVLSPGPSDYEKAVYYNTFDVTGAVKEGRNAIASVLGNGRYFNMRQNYKPEKIKTFGFPKLILQLDIEYVDGTHQTIFSDESWKVTSDGPIRSNNEWDGEEYDATRELSGWNSVGYHDKDWARVELVKEPGGILTAQMNKNMKVMESLKPIAIKKINADTFIIDMGQNMVGWLKLQVKGERGRKVSLHFGESLRGNGRLYDENLRSAKATDIYTLKGTGVETWEPSFVYQGFRFVQVTGFPGEPSLSDFEGKVVYDEMENTGSFESSDATLNQIYKNAYWGIRGNYKGMPVDCPQRDERQPWLADRAIGSHGESFLFDNGRLYAKWLDDIEQSQKADGQLPDMSPSFYKTYYSDNMTWPGTYILIANMLYDQFGDKQPIARHYDSMKKWLTYMRTKYMVDGLLTKDKYGDWCVPPESKELIHSRDTTRMTDGVLIATAYYYRMLTLMERFATLLNKPEDIKEYEALSEKIKVAFNNKFLQKKAKKYSNNTVTANLLPLYFGMVPDSVKDGVFQSIVEKTMRQSNGHISSGLIGTSWLMRGLSDNGRADVAYRMATNRDYPSWGYMAENGATTIWELWNGNTASPKMNSHNHVMLLGDLMIWYYENLAGIKTSPDHPAFKKLVMKPAIIDQLKNVNASFHSVHGWIKSEWKKDIGSFTWKITLPGNTRALIYIPANSEKEVMENGIAAGKAEGVKFIRMEGQSAVFEIGSGEYNFVSSFPWRSGIVTDEYIFDRASFPESHASTIAETSKGLVAAWFGGTKEGFPDVTIWVSRKEKNKWTAPVEVANGIQNDSLRFACYNPVLFQVPGGDLLLFYKVGSKVATWKGYMISSKDAGLTWSKPQTLPEGFLGPVKNKPVLLKNGTLLCPSSTEGNGWKVHFEATKDWGKTWEKIGPINDGKTMNAIQPSILSYKDGRLQVLCRSKNRAILESWSSDNGKTWSPMAATSLPNNNSGTDAVTLADGRQLLVYNHVLPPNGLAKGPRTPLNVAISDDGKTWYASLVLEDSPINQYSYPSVIQTSDGLVHIVYTWRRLCIKHVVIDPSKLQTKKIENGLWPGQKTDVKMGKVEEE
jgi:alpha-L-rhamnosidase